jgi:hypothetical protein
LARLKRRSRMDYRAHPRLRSAVTKVLSVGSAMAMLAFALTACGGGDNLSSEDVQQAAAAAVKKAQQQQRIKDLQGQVNKIRKGQSDSTDSSSSSSSGSSSSGAGNDCGGGVSAGPNTTCGFAQNVAGQYRESGSSVVRAFSPTTGETYAMTCSGTDPVICRGGNNASVYIN